MVHLFRYQLTGARLDALQPRVAKVCVADISAFTEPSATRGATSELTGNLILTGNNMNAALGTHTCY